MWIIFTLMAAFMQAWRNAFQSRLSRDVNVAGVTLARFVYAGPLAAVYLLSLYAWQDAGLPQLGHGALQYIIGAALAQILATALMVKLFQLQNFAVGAGLAKSEALVAAVLGSLFFGTALTVTGWLGVLVGTVAVFLLSTHGGLKGLSFKTLLLGLGCGSAFALTSLWVREASLVLGLPFPHRAAWVLLLVILLQTLLLLAWLLIKDKETLKKLWQRPRLTLAISISSCLGSIGWFSAMSLTAVPYVKTLGQVEVFFMMLISSLWLKQRIKVKDMGGLVLIALAAVLVLWG
ncbi:DMT family transporter [Shewanella algae]|uniref:DMT family transporter n=1 Tax=Shewanella algae TaxID=38313 RepID=UPI000C32E0E1|nr:DMT family transporter [Shewanella algae]MBO2621384.1 DMT family transporter [Shewanella algae]MBO2642426.1 DMT family transporter [Shewanella algae]TVO80337.1 multidrug transporter [Shewanella algae]BCV50583.1 multidrug transporter [Shewanella algae]